MKREDGELSQLYQDKGGHLWTWKRTVVVGQRR
jgi:hypothetical protein